MRCSHPFAGGTPIAVFFSFLWHSWNRGAAGDGTCIGVAQEGPNLASLYVEAREEAKRAGRRLHS